MLAYLRFNSFNIFLVLFFLCIYDNFRISFLLIVLSLVLCSDNFFCRDFIICSYLNRYSSFHYKLSLIFFLHFFNAKWIGGYSWTIFPVLNLSYLSLFWSIKLTAIIYLRQKSNSSKQHFSRRTITISSDKVNQYKRPVFSLYTAYFIFFLHKIRD